MITLFRVFCSTSMTCKTSPAEVPKIGAFFMMNNCSFSVVQSIRHVADKDLSVVTLPRPTAAKESIASIIWESFWESGWVLMPRSWSAMRRRRWRLAATEGDWDWSVREERVTVVAKLLLGSGKLRVAGSERLFMAMCTLLISSGV